MIDGINDTDAMPHALADLLRGDLAHVNLIPMNPVAHTPWTGSAAAARRALRRAPARRRDRDHDPLQPRAPRSGRPAGSWRPSAPDEPTPPAVARRRERDRRRKRGRPARRAERRAAARGRGRAERGGRRPAEVLVAASILDSDLGAPERGDPARRGGRGGSHPPRRDGRPLRPQHHLRAGRRSSAVRRRHRAAVRRAPHDLRARPVLDGVPRRWVRLDHLPRGGRSGPGTRRRWRGSARPVARRACRSSPATPLDSARPVSRPARHRARDDGRARVRRAGVHGRRRPAKLGPARGWLDPAGACEVQVDGGGRSSTAAVIGRGGADVIVAGSALYRAPDMRAEIERIRTIAGAARAATIAV